MSDSVSQVSMEGKPLGGRTSFSASTWWPHYWTLLKSMTSLISSCLQCDKHMHRHAHTGAWAPTHTHTHKPGRSKMCWCCLNSSGEAMLTVYSVPHQKEAMGPNSLCSSIRNWWRLPALPMSFKFPFLHATIKCFWQHFLSTFCQSHLLKTISTFTKRYNQKQREKQN